MKVVTYAAAALGDSALSRSRSTPGRRSPPIGSERRPVARRRRARPLARAEPAAGDHPAVSGGSRLTATGLLKAYKGRPVVNDVSVQLEPRAVIVRGWRWPIRVGRIRTYYMSPHGIGSPTLVRAPTRASARPDVRP